eukprot:scaffold21212_cov101-Isochrysis_galbana.AAC.2
MWSRAVRLVTCSQNSLISSGFRMPSPSRSNFLNRRKADSRSSAPRPANGPPLREPPILPRMAPWCAAVSASAPASSIERTLANSPVFHRSATFHRPCADAPPWPADGAALPPAAIRGSRHLTNSLKSSTWFLSRSQAAPTLARGSPSRAAATVIRSEPRRLTSALLKMWTARSSSAVGSREIASHTTSEQAACESSTRYSTSSSSSAAPRSTSACSTAEKRCSTLMNSGRSIPFSAPPSMLLAIAPWSKLSR